jgi:Tfp pilus assembly protein FimT
MPRQSPQTNSRARRLAGFSTIELLVVATLLTVITAFGFIGINKARASVRLNGAARELAAYIEKSRIHSIRKHADDAAQRARVAFNANKTSYDVTMDLDGDGTMDTRTIVLPSGVSFDPTDNLEMVAFDWRGRTWRTAAGITEQNAQVSIRMQNSDDSVSIDVTGSGDVTVDSLVFDDAVPNVNLHVGDLTASASPAATPLSGPSPAAAASPSVPPLGDVLPSPSPILDLGGLPSASPTPSSSPSSSPSPSPSPSPSSVANPSPSPSPSPIAPCTITTDKALVTLSLSGTTTIRVGHSADTTIAITGTSSKPTDLQVTPGGAQNVAPGARTTFTLKAKKLIGSYSVTFSANCGSKTVPVNVVSVLLF